MDFVPVVTFLCFVLEEIILLHETWQVPCPNNSSSREQVTISAFTAHSYMKLVPDLGSLCLGYAVPDRREGRARRQTLTLHVVGFEV